MPEEPSVSICVVTLLFCHFPKKKYLNLPKFYKMLDINIVLIIINNQAIQHNVALGRMN